jgi:hypothetical protein
VRERSQLHWRSCVTRGGPSTRRKRSVNHAYGMVNHRKPPRRAGKSRQRSALLCGAQPAAAAGRILLAADRGVVGTSAVQYGRFVRTLRPRASLRHLGQGGDHRPNPPARRGPDTISARCLSGTGTALITDHQPARRRHHGRISSARTISTRVPPRFVAAARVRQ